MLYVKNYPRLKEVLRLSRELGHDMKRRRARIENEMRFECTRCGTIIINLLYLSLAYGAGSSIYYPRDWNPTHTCCQTVRDHTVLKILAQ